MLLNLRLYPDDLLVKPTKKVDVKTELESIQRLFKAFKETNYYLNGAGLAANQVGMNMKFALINPGADEEYKSDEEFIIINPEILERSDPVQMEEGCLSCPGASAKVTRFNKIKIKFTDLAGNEQTKEFTGKMAQIMQHECDHLEGKLFFQSLSLMKQDIVKKKIKKYRKKKGLV